MWNFIRNNWLYAFINIFGLTASLTFVILLAVYVNRQLTTDAFQKNADRIYVYANENFIGSAYYLQKHLTENFPEIEKATSLFTMNAIGSLFHRRWTEGPDTQDYLCRQLVFRHILVQPYRRLCTGMEGIRQECRHQQDIRRHLFSRP